MTKPPSRAALFLRIYGDIKDNLSLNWRGGPSMVVSISPTVCHTCGAPLSRDGKWPKISGASPGSHLLHAMPVSIDRRGQGVRYVLLAPLPLAFRRAEISALTVQAPGWCRFSAQLAQLVGTRRSNSKATITQILMAPGPKARRNRGNHPGFARRIIP